MALRFLLPASIALASAACAGTPQAAGAANDGATFIIVRHAEKADDTARDPDLSPAGHERALELARLLAGEDLVAIHATGFRRTRQTVQPTAEAHGIEPTAYNAAQPPGEFAARLRSDHPRGTILVAGHSNTVPGIVAALCSCATEEMPETEYDRLNTIHIDTTGQARLHVTRYGAPSPRP